MSCRICGAPTSRRVCRQCEIEERAEERARARERLDQTQDQDEDDDEGEDPVLLPDGGTVDIGDLHAAAVLDHDGEAVLAIKGTDGGVRLHVPEDMVDPLEGTVHELNHFYADRLGTGCLIGDGGYVPACPDCGDARIRRRTPEHPASTAAGNERYRCRACGIRFDTPTDRERRAEPARSGTAKVLAEADASDFCPDGGREAESLATAIDRAEAERRARQAARSLDYWSRRARLDLLAIVQDETPVAVWTRSGNRGSPTNTPGITDHGRPTYRLTCRDCPFEAVSSGSNARDQLDRARDVHRTAFGHDVLVETASGTASQLQTDGGPDR